MFRQRGGGPAEPTGHKCTPLSPFLRGHSSFLCEALGRERAWEAGGGHLSLPPSPRPPSTSCVFWRLLRGCASAHRSWRRIGYAVHAWWCGSTSRVHTRPGKRRGPNAPCGDPPSRSFSLSALPFPPQPPHSPLPTPAPQTARGIRTGKARIAHQGLLSLLPLLPLLVFLLAAAHTQPWATFFPTAPTAAWRLADPS